MGRGVFLFSAIVVAFAQAGCGLTAPQVPEVWDRTDELAQQHMEMQIKRAIFCELREAAIKARQEAQVRKEYRGQDVTTDEDSPLPSSWGAQIELTFTVDETSALSPGVSFKTPMHNAPVNFRGEVIGVDNPFISALSYGAASIAQSYAFGLGGTISSQAIRYDKYNFYYSMAHLIDRATNDDICHKPPTLRLGPDSHSSPFLVQSNLGIREWLPQAVVMNNFERSSREAMSGEGKPLGKDISDVMTYDIKFTVISSLNATPTWDLVRIAANSAGPFFNTNRTRTHELLITVGPGAESNKSPIRLARSGRVIIARNAGPSEAAFAAHLSSQIGSAVANALRGR